MAERDDEYRVEDADPNRHGATYFMEGWTVDCECGWSGAGRTKLECAQAHNAHKTAQKKGSAE